MRKKIDNWHEVARFWQPYDNFLAMLNNCLDFISEEHPFVFFIIMFLFFFPLIFIEESAIAGLGIIIFLIIYLFAILAVLIIFLYLEKEFRVEIICCEEGIIEDGRRFVWGKIKGVVVRESELKLALDIEEHLGFLIINLDKLQGHFITPKEIFNSDKKILVGEDEININNLNLAALNLLYILRRRAYKAKWGGDVVYQRLLPG